MTAPCPSSSPSAAAAGKKRISRRNSREEVEDRPATRPRKAVILLASALAVLLLLRTTVPLFLWRVPSAEDRSSSSSSSDFSRRLLLHPSSDGHGERVSRLREACRKYSDPFRPESGAITETVRAFGVEVVTLRGPFSPSSSSTGGTHRPRAAVCVPHKAGSHSWGRFARELLTLQLAAESEEAEAEEREWAALDFAARAEALRVRAVAVRHPMSRLLSVYRMAFERWCDEGGFLFKQWRGAVCAIDFEKADREMEEEEERKKSDDGLIPSDASDLGSFLSGALKQHREGNDRFMLRLWRRFHPDRRRDPMVDPHRQIAFTFQEFVEFLLEPRLEGDDGADPAPLLSYHWAPYWKECPSVCSSGASSPDLVVRMETLGEDVREVTRRIGLEGEGEGEGAKMPSQFPHTHRQEGGHSSEEELASRYFSQLSKSTVLRLYDKYRLDHELFGYDPQPFVDMAKEDEEERHF